MLCCTVYLPGFFTIPPVDRDESRFAQASRQMFESVALPESERDPELHQGGLAVPMVGGTPRLNKPPLIYWMQSASAVFFTRGDPLVDAVWMYRVPSLLAGVVIVLTTWRLGVSMFDGRTGWVAAALLAVAPVFVWEAHQARADMVMVAWTTLAMGRLWTLWSGRVAGSRFGSWVSAALLWVFVALGVLTKGPITPMVVVLTVVTLAILSRRVPGESDESAARDDQRGRRGGWRWVIAMRPLLGLVVVAACVAPWVYAVAQHVGLDRYWSIVYDEVFARAGSAKEGHWGPPGYHLVLMVVLFWPGSLLTGLSVVRAWRTGLRHPDEREVAPGRLVWVRRAVESLRSMRTAQPAEAFLLAWLVPGWVVFELVGTKLPHYTMPMYPAVALITARGLMVWTAAYVPEPGRVRAGALLWFGVGCVLLFGLGFAWIWTPGGTLVWWVPVLLAGAVYAMVKTFRTIPDMAFVRTQAWSVLAAWLLLIAFLGAVAPGVFGLSQAAYQAATAHAKARPITWVGFNEDSVTWFARGRPSFTEPDDLERWFKDHPNGVAVISRFAEDVYLKHPLEMRPVKFVFGVHYAKGRGEKLAIVECVPE